MDNINLNNPASIARKKRKCALREKGISFSRSKIQQSSSKDVHILNSTPSLFERTPLSQISLKCINQRDRKYSLLKSNGASSSSYHTQPSTIHEFTRKKTSINHTSLGINLMSRYHTLCEDEFNTNAEKDKENLFPFCTSQTFTNNLPNDNNNEDDDNDEYSMKGINIEYSSEDEEQFDNSSFTSLTSIEEGYFDIGDPIIECEHCGACRIQLPFLRAPPPILEHLLFDLKSNDSVNYQNNIRLYNMMFAFTSLGAKIDRSINNGGGPPTIRIQGQPCQRIGSMLPMSGQFPKFAQLYIYDTEHEIENRMNGIRDNNVDSQVVMKLSKMFRRYMDQLYFDGMAICSSLGFPDLFLTMTCNPNWPEIVRILKLMGLKPHDRPDIILRVFKMKFEELLHDLKKIHVLGKILAYMYTIEFQKRGLPHAHLLIFLHPSYKYPTPDDIDRIICVENPNQSDNPKLHNFFKSRTIHGPCGSSNRYFPCMKDGKCSRYFPKKFSQTTVVDEDGYPLYRRRDIGNIVEKNGEQPVYFNDNDEIDNIFSRSIVSESMFTSWMEANKQYPEGRNLCYGQYVSKFVYVKRSRTWKPRKSGYTIGRLIWISPCTGELYYLRMMLTMVKGATCYEDIRTVSDIQYSTFRDACFAMGLLQDDREYMEALKEAYDWGSGFYLRKLFVTMLLSTSMNKLDHVCEETWKWLCDDILYNQRNIANNQDEQCKIFKTVMQAINQEQGCMFFLYGYGGTSQTHMWRTLTYALRSQKQIVLIVASSGIASLLLQGGRTTHSKFKISVPSLENSIWNIHQGSELAGLLKQTKLFIWDEAPISQKFCFEAHDKSLGDIMGTTTNDSIIFGGKVVVFGGDFRQILPVIPRGAILASTIDIVDQINEYVLSIIPGEEKDYLSSDSVDMFDVNDIETVNILTTKFLNTLSTFGLPNHKIKLNVGTTIMLLRNLDFATSLEPKRATLLEPKLATSLETKRATSLEPKLATSLEPHIFYCNVQVKDLSLPW
ncbi:hypothetical protein Lal_00034015 [Lupinus albus]|nr:hypothetical protein Lal_00034015 [Lupinus albus]